MKNLNIYKASAGSGKTFTLAVEYISLLVIDPTEYQRILAVTFTNKATAEMKQRILSQLYGLSNGLKNSDDYLDAIKKSLSKKRTLPQYQEASCQAVFDALNDDVIRKRAGEALSNIIHDYSRFHIETIDSFFQGIVKELANELDLSTNMKVELDGKEVLSDAVDEIIDELKEYSVEFNSVVHFIEEKIAEGKSWKISDTVKAFGENIFKENYLIHGEDVKNTITNKSIIDQYSQVLSQNIERRKLEITNYLKPWYEKYVNAGYNEKNNTLAVYKLLLQAHEDKIEFPNINKSNGTLSVASFTKAVFECTTNTDKFFKSKANNIAELTPFIENELQPVLRTAFTKVDEYKKHILTVRAISQHLYNLMLLNEISKKVKDLNTEANRFLLSETANFLHNVIDNQNLPFIYEKTGSTIKHLMIDEFQDTSALQWDNFKPLVKNSIDMGGTCLIVGDVKQSIYRFRNSDWKILNEIESDRELKKHIEKIPSEYNFRSTRNIVEFNNDLFINSTSVLNGEYKESHNLDCTDLLTAYGSVKQEAKKQDKVGFVRVESIDYHAFDKDNLPEEWKCDTPKEYDQATLQRIQLSVKNLIDNRVSANDITILIRTNKEVADISDYFNEHQDVLNVKIVSDEAFRLDASPAINIIIYALRALAAQDDKLHLATLAYYYKTIVLKDTIIRDNLSLSFLAENAEQIEKLLPNKFGKYDRFDLQYKSLVELIEDIYRIFQLERIENQDAYLFYFNDIVEQYCQDNYTDIDSFLTAWDEKLCSKTIPNGVSDGVRIMTMHKSKGLEFHSVIIPSCSWPIKAKDKEVMWCVPSCEPYNQMPLLPITVGKATTDTIFANDRDNEELKTLVDNINVLYVAFTRAEKNLIILTGNKIDSPLDMKANVADAQSFILKSMPNDMMKSELNDAVTVYQKGDILPSKEKKEEDNENIMTAKPSPQPVTFKSYPPIADFRQSHESDLFITEDSDNEKIKAHANRIRLISKGNLYHNIFQNIATIGDVPRAVRLLESKGCFTNLLEVSEAQEAVTQLIEEITPEHPEWFSAEWKVLNERTILHRYEGEDFCTSNRPDRVIVKGNEAILIDYKTAQGVAGMKEDGTFYAPSENIIQIKKYAELLRELGYENVKSYLWYILDKIVVPVTK